jgi:hypothetical protein
MIRQHPGTAASGRRRGFARTVGTMTEREVTDEPQVDPHYLELLRGSKLPSAYLPPMMAGPRKPWIRVCAAIVIGCFLAATTAGVCLTYGLHL